MRLLRAVTFACLCSVVGCVLFTDLDGLTGGTDAHDASPETAAQDATTMGADALQPPHEAGTGFCDTTGADAAYCEDFDRLTDVSSLVPESSAPGLVNITQGAYRSPPRALRFTLPAGESGQYAVVRHSFPTERPVRLELDMWLQQVVATSPGQTMQFHSIDRMNASVALERNCVDGDAGPECAYFVSVCIFNREGGSPCENHFFDQHLASLDGFSRIALEARFAETGGYFKLEQDGATLLDVQTVTHLGTLPADAPTNVTVGVGTVFGKAGATNIVVDTVLIDVR
jgi:hypothetical protein